MTAASGSSLSPARAEPAFVGACDTGERLEFTEPLRTSPAVNTPGWLVSSIIGWRRRRFSPSPSEYSAAGPVGMKPWSSSSMVPCEPRRVGHGTDEDEQRPRVDRLALALHHLPGLSAARRARRSVAVLSSPRPTRSAHQIQAISPWLGSGPDGLEWRLHRRWARASSARTRGSAISCGTNPGWVETAASRSIAACASSKDLRRRRGATVLPPIRRWPGHSKTDRSGSGSPVQLPNARAGDRSGRSALPTTSRSTRGFGGRPSIPRRPRRPPV